MSSDAVMVLVAIFSALRSPNKAKKIEGARELRETVTAFGRESPNNSLQLNQEVNKQIFDLIKSPDPSHRLGGVLAIDQLIAIDQSGEDSVFNATRFTHYLRQVLQNSDIEGIKAAAAAMGKLTTIGSLAGELVDYEVKRCIEWLTLDRLEFRRHAAAIELRAIAVNSPTLMFGFIYGVVEALWSGVRDPKLATRQDSVAALGVCLEIVLRRDSHVQEQVYSSVWKETVAGIKSTTAPPETVHGSLLVYRELLLHAGGFMQQRYRDTVESVFRLKDHKDVHLRRTVVEILPSFAAYNPVVFTKYYLGETMIHFQALLATGGLKNIEKGQVFVATANIALAVRSSMAPFLDPILDQIREVLGGSKARVRRELEPAIFRCLEKFAQAFGQAFTKYLDRPLLTLVFSSGLTRPFYECLTSLFANIPALREEIRDFLLDIVSHGLSGYSYKIPGQSATSSDILSSSTSVHSMAAPSVSNTQVGGELSLGAGLGATTSHILYPGVAAAAVSRMPKLGNGAVESRISDTLAREYREGMLAKIGPEAEMDDNELVKVLLTILSEFDFRGRLLATFCRDCIIKYTDNPDAKVRKAAALTCLSIFIREPVHNQMSANSLQILSTVLQKLLVIGATDVNYDIRLEVLRAIDPVLDPHIAQPEKIRLLFMVANDELFAVRQVALTILARLSRINPAYVVPSLRRSMIELLNDLEYSKNSRGKEESAKLLSTLMRESQSLVRPYVDPILRVLVPTARSAVVSTVSSSVMDAVGDLCSVGGKRMLPHVSELMPLILDMLQDQASLTRRDTALRTLGTLAANSEYVIEPYYQYPKLLGILVKILTSDSNKAIQRETVRLIGILGALDPYKYREIEREAEGGDAGEQDSVPIDVKLVLKGMPPSSEDYNPTVVISSLMALLKDPAMATNHTRIVQAVLRIFESLGLKCVLFLDQVIPGLIQAMRSNTLAMADLLFRQISTLTTVVKQHIRPYLPQVFDVTREYFKYPELRPSILILLESLAQALAREFKVYMPEVLPSLIGILQSDDPESMDSKVRVLQSLPMFGANLEEYVHLIVPNVVNLFYFSPQNLRVAALNCISDLSQLLRLDSMASRIIHPLLRILNSTNDEQVRQVCLETLCIVCFQLGSGFAVFVEAVQPTITRIRANSLTANAAAQSSATTAAAGGAPPTSVAASLAAYEKLVTRVLRGEPLPPNMNPYRKPLALSRHNESQPEQSTQLQINQAVLKQSWDTTGRSTRDDWTEWFRRFSIEFLRQSPSPAMRACADIATTSPTLARDLFNPSFYSVWILLYDQNKEDLIRNIQVAMGSANIPPEVLQTLLTLAEFMERDDKPFPLSPRVLANYAQKCHAYAKALHHKELDFIADPSSATIESLIAINNQLQQSDAAIGILKHAQHHHTLQLKETWYEKLQRWEEALAAYREREKLEPDSMEVTMGKMRCLHALGEWEQLAKIARDKWTTASSDARRAVAPLAAAAAWGLSEWEQMNTYVRMIRNESPDRSFFNSVLSLHRNDFVDANKQIQHARDQLIPELTALVSESYNRAYGVVVRVQMLAELEEIGRYKQLPEEAVEDRETMVKTWEKRLMGNQHNVDIWQRVLNVRTLVMEPKQNMGMWIKFANLCRKSHRLGLAEKALNMLLDVDSSNRNRAPPQVVYAQLKFMWTTGNQQDAVKYLVDFTTRMSHDLNLSSNDDLISQPLPSELPESTPEIQNYTRLLARCFLKQGEWQIALTPDWKQQPERKASILGSYLLATHFDAEWYKAWHNWAIANFEVVSMQQDDENSHTENGGADSANSENEHVVQAHVVPAIKGFFHSITLAHKSALQDTLRLLTLWFRYGGIPEPARALSEGFTLVNIENWLDVVPQLISRIHQTDSVVRDSLHGLLTDLGKKHPQALVYPLQVCIKSDNEFRKMAAQSILDQMRLHSSYTSLLVQQADLVSQELIRVAVLWHEQWHEGLEDASRYFFVEKNIPKMFSTLEPLHDTLQRGATTLREMSFQSAFGRDLHDAWEWGQNYKKTGDESHLNQAWDIYYSVFRRITRQLPQLTSLDLQYVSPSLLNARNLKLAVPGSYEPGKPEITITSFDPTFTVISSKQRPRRFVVKGSDGKDYQFLLKGHEDLRQDSLVMQLFGLVNTLLGDNPECFKRHLTIQRYPVIPLSPKAGLIGWVPHSDTLHYLIREYREGKSLLNIEHRIMIQMAPDYESLTHLQKIEVFTYALDNTKGQDLYRILWLKSRSSEAWLNRRTQYTRSLAVMSMVGYILGLGDRHPLNLMLDRVSGRIIHIDFGDCFEAAILRDKFPEKVPFRLTRMLTYAMEVSGVEGSYRITCEHVMALLRDNMESLMAILEAFANDPLINWGFELPNKPKDTEDRQPLSVVIADTTGLTDEQRREAEARTARAQFVLRRIRDKLTGNDFKRYHDLTVPDQVDLLIQEATNIENLCQHFIGWCAFW